MNKLIVILGPTASGKTELAIKLAKKFNGEIVCADSRQIYAGMTIGTASHRADLSKKYLGLPYVAHHLFNFREPNKPLNVATYKKMAEKTIKDIQKRGKIPFLVGGTAFYIYSVVEGWQFPKSKANPALRKQLESRSPAELFKILQKLDKARAKNIDKNNKRRLIRAIEIARELGKVPLITKKPQFDCLVLGINPNKEELKKRIENRTKKMIELGLEKEVGRLIKKYGWTAVLQNTIGYSEWQKFWKLPSKLQKGACSATSAPIPAISLHTVQFAKRQITWFKRDKRIRWVKNHQQAANLTKKFTETGFLQTL